MTADLHRALPGLLVLSLVSGCGWGHPPRPQMIAAPPPPAQVFAVPEAFARAADRAGPVADAYAQTATTSELEDELSLGDEDDEPMIAGDVAVAPILAVTGTVTYDLPMPEDPRIDHWVEFLTGRGRGSFSRWLGRSTRYVPLFWSILEQYELPKDLVFLSMIESGFSPRAYSWAHAAGPWQFMPYTGRRFGLKVGFWVDERRDFVKATHAAAQYLTRLHGMFGDWHLAMAAYNAGPGKVRRAIRHTGTDDFWRISRTWRLRRETRHYVPKLLAAARIAKQPEAHGFDDVVYLAPLEWDVLTVTVATDLETLARACELGDVEALERLNPELRCRTTPPGSHYSLRVPKARHETCASGLARLNPAARMTYRYYLLRPEDTLEGIAALHRTTPDAILRFNRMQAEQLHDHEELVVPLPLVVADEVPVVEPDARKFRGGSYRPDGQQLIVHRVRSGDSLWRIARRYRVGLRKLRLWNGLWKGSRLRIGQRVKIYVGRGRAPSSPGAKRARTKRKGPISHKVRSGESLWSIAQRYGVTVKEIRRSNRLAGQSVLQPGQRLRIE